MHDVYLVQDNNGDWFQLPYDDPYFEYADVMIKHHPRIGFEIHIGRRHPLPWELDELMSALRCCSRYQPEVPMV